ncbi:MAG: hypothetical protein HN909_08140 [Phycisphaerales bacterium]|jgi:alpha-glucosidase|nr:hypothetical protein [Phycisphaerales bacterium]MBT7171725.1 hypothetical protein [Phycisphaerales bacterium]
MFSRSLLSATTAGLFALLCAGAPLHAESIVVKSPNAKVVTTVSISEAGHLQYSVTRDGAAVLDQSPLGIVVNGNDLGAGATLGTPGEPTSVDMSYPWVGNKSTLVNRHNQLIIPIKSKTNWALHVRAFDDGVAVRYVVPGKNKRQIDSESTAFTLPKGSTVWHRVNKASYEKLSYHSPVETLESGYNMQYPLTIVLPNKGGYAALTEAGSFLFSGQSLVATGTTTLTTLFANNPKGWKMDGEIVSPWRIVMAAATLNDLVNCDIVYNVCPQPDKTLFPKGKQTEWIKPGRALWNWWAYGKGGIKWSKQKAMVDSAAKMNCQYYLVDDGWEEPKGGWFKKGKEDKRWKRLKELADYAKTKNVSILVWRRWKTKDKHHPGIETHDKRVEFFSKLVECGVVGAKIDFLSAEGLSIRKFVVDTLKVAAKHKIMVNFHGSAKPTGESKTWPNEVSREGIFGLEHNRLPGDKLSPSQYCVFPFGRNLAGHADFTPTTFQKSRLFGTTFSLQLAVAVIENSSVLCWADKPEIYLNSPALTFIQSIPPVWDETRILPGSEIGTRLVMARRKGNDWYAVVINGDAKNSVTHSLDLSFLGEGIYDATYSRDNMDKADAMVVEKDQTAKPSDTLTINMRPGGGFVARFIRK